MRPHVGRMCRRARNVELAATKSTLNGSFHGKGSACLAGYKLDHGVGQISSDAIGGFWYSMPAAGQCKGGRRPGQAAAARAHGGGGGSDVSAGGDAGCTWRVAKEGKHVNASCVNDGIDRVVEAHGKACFSKYYVFFIV